MERKKPIKTEKYARKDGQKQKPCKASKRWNDVLFHKKKLTF